MRKEKQRKDTLPGRCPCAPCTVGNIYEIRVLEAIDPSWTHWFDGMEILRASDGTTMLAGLLVDQAALHGVLAKIRDLHLTIISLQRRPYS